MRKIIFILLVTCIGHAKSTCQTVINTTGNTVQDANNLFEYAVGEIGITTIPGTGPSTSYITQGLLQPNVKMIDPACQVVNDTIQYFPTPAKNILSVVTRFDWITGYHIYAADGKLVRVSSFVNNQIDLTNLPAAVYFIRVFPGCSNKFRTLKVMKQ